MKIEIYRYKHYINAVESKKDLHKWLLDNLSCDNTKKVLPPTTSLEDCVDIARWRGYTFQAESGMERIDNILENVKIEEVAASFMEIKKRGKNYIFDCPFCEGKASGYISPKHQIYKCFTCGKSGNVVNFVMDIKRISFEEALKYLEETYKIK